MNEIFIPELEARLWKLRLHISWLVLNSRRFELNIVIDDLAEEGVQLHFLQFLSYDRCNMYVKKNSTSFGVRSMQI